MESNSIAGGHHFEDERDTSDSDDVKIVARSKRWRLCEDVKIKTEVLDEIENFSIESELHTEELKTPDVKAGSSTKGRSVDYQNSNLRQVNAILYFKSSTVANKRRDCFDLKKYIAAVTTEKRLVCTVCNIEFSNEIEFETHVTGSDHKRFFQCRLCETHFSSSLALKDHFRMHSTVITFACKRCNLRFLEKETLTRHEADAHSRSKSSEWTAARKKRPSRRVPSRDYSPPRSDARPYSCPICKKRFLRPSSLRAHTIVHTAASPYACDLCPARFKRSSVLKTHKLTHSDVRRFECDICKHRFHLKGALKHHILAHYGVRPYKCAECGKRYRRSWGLKLHTYRHTGVKRFECDLCKSRFSVKTKLAKHIYEHTGEKPYKCDLCGRQYGERYLLKAHKCATGPESVVRSRVADRPRALTQVLFFRPKSKECNGSCRNGSPP